jgi:radical SAM superfamily enzyme YgiQ (UPF0313 family)
MVLLYQPPYTVGDERAFAYVPLALLQLAAALEKGGWEPVILDGQVDRGAAGALTRRAPQAAAVGITAMSGPQLAHALAAAEGVRDAAPDVPIIWGGWHPSLLPEQTAADPLVDYVCRGPGEQTLVELLDRLAEDPAAVEQVQGITFRRNGRIVTTADRPLAGLDPDRRLPFERIDVARYGGRLRTDGRFAAAFSFAEGQPFVYTSSVGCPYRCRFCAASAVYRRKWFALPVDRTLAEIERLVRGHDVRSFYFVDPEFFIDARRVEALMRGLLDRGLRIFWKAQVRPEHILRLGAERMRLAYAAGCRQLEIGAESGSPEMLEHIQKDSTPEAAIRSAAMLRGSGITAQYNLIFGFPTETERHVAETLAFAAHLKRANPDCLLPMYYFTPHPGIPMMAEAVAAGYRPPTSLRQWARESMSYAQPTMPWIADPGRLKDRVMRAIVFYLPLAYPGNCTRGTLQEVRRRMHRLPDALWLWPAAILARLRAVCGDYDLPLEYRLFTALRRALARS